jgi:GNAT superfamily N-acetyltransferase
VLIRPARPDDIALIAAWTQDTFDWGDYVAERLPEWIDNPAAQVIVAEDAGAIVATVTGTMVSPTEAWAQGIRVHPDHRRKGIGTAVSTVLWKWVREQGAVVVRLAIDETNVASQAQAGSMGFRKLCQWRRGERVIGEGSPVPEGNGGRRVPPPERLESAHSAEAEPAFLSWSTGELARAAHGLLPIGWVWRRMTVDHLMLAARSRDLHEGRPGWAIAEVDSDDNMLLVHWMETAADDAGAMALALVDLAAEARVGEMRIWVPTVDWLETAFIRLGFEFHTVGVWAMEL